MMRIRTENRGLFTVLLVGLIALAWLELTLWSLSPYAEYLNHDLIGHLPFSFSADYLVLLIVFVFGWLLMTVAMMLPTSLPLITLFRRMVRRRKDGLLLVALLIVGYLGVWTLFGGLAHMGDLLVHEAVHRLSWLEANRWLIAATTLLVAGLYQFTPLKYACLDKCRSPLTFITQHWQGQRERRESLLLGAHHGLFCIGCCWSLMLLMFVVGMTNVVWMLLLGAVMAAEKNMPWGRRLSLPLGAVLVGSSAVILLISLAGS